MFPATSRRGPISFPLAMASRHSILGMHRCLRRLSRIVGHRVLVGYLPEHSRGFSWAAYGGRSDLALSFMTTPSLRMSSRCRQVCDRHPIPGVSASLPAVSVPMMLASAGTSAEARRPTASMRFPTATTVASWSGGHAVAVHQPSLRQSRSHSGMPEWHTQARPIGGLQYRGTI